jgi:hypothetical protein
MQGKSSWCAGTANPTNVHNGSDYASHDSMDCLVRSVASLLGGGGGLRMQLVATVNWVIKQGLGKSWPGPRQSGVAIRFATREVLPGL